MPNLVLYYRKSCPFCIKVLNFLETQKREIPLKEIGEDQEAFQELSRVGKKTQVPCLFIDGIPLFESLDIIDWFKNNS